MKNIKGIGCNVKKPEKYEDLKDMIHLFIVVLQEHYQQVAGFWNRLYFISIVSGISVSRVLCDSSCQPLVVSQLAPIRADFFILLRSFR